MSPKAAAAAELISLFEQVPAHIVKIAKAEEARLERLCGLHERLAVWVLEKQAAAESLGPAQDSQNVAPAPQKTLQELMGTPDIQKWFKGSVRGLAKRSQLPYALVGGGGEVETNMEQAQLKAILQKYLAAQGQ